jgi:predicted nucleic acid-binding protein
VIKIKDEKISGHETHTGRMKDAYKIVVDKPEKKSPFETLHVRVQRRIILK